MYLDALEFLEEERDGWAPFEALAALSDEQLERPLASVHGWSGRDLMAHLLAYQQAALDVARELAVNESSPTMARYDADWAERGSDAINADLTASWMALPMDELRERFRSLPGELRGYLTVVPETRWVKHAAHVAWFQDETIDHYREHISDLEAVLASTK